MSPSTKQPHAAVQYREAEKDEACATCRMFIAGDPAHCTEVEDPIFPEGVCDLWAERKGRVPRVRVPAGVVDASYTVKAGAVASERTPGLTYVDYRLHPKFWPFVAAHEQAERKVMAEGMPYLKAHREYGNPAERAMVQSEGKAWGYSWERYTHEIDGELEHIEYQHGTRPPPPDPHVNIADAVGHHRDKP